MLDDDDVPYEVPAQREPPQPRHGDLPVRLGDPAHVLALLQEAQECAEAIDSGHLTILRFSSEWKVMLGTPNLDDDYGQGSGRDEVWQLQGFTALEAALADLLAHHPRNQWAAIAEANRPKGPHLTPAEIMAMIDNGLQE